MYDSLSADYDRFVNWKNRLAFEMPFIQAQIDSIASKGRQVRVLDAACGTGMHAIELARRGFEAAGADLSAGMIERARENAREAGTPVDFRVAGFGELAEEFSDFDVLLCLGNSLPHVSGQEALGRAVEDFAGCLRIGGLLMVQNRNFDAVMQRGERWMGPEAARAGDREWLFMRFYDFDPDGRITFHVATLTRQGDAPWEQKVDSTRLYPLRQAELEGALRQAGFDRLVSYGDMGGDPFDSRSSGNLVVSAIYQGK